MSKFYKMFTIALLMLLAMMYSCDDGKEAIINNINIKGSLVNEEGDPIEGAIVKAYQKLENEEFSTLLDSSLTDENGQVEITTIPESLNGITILITHKEYVTIDKSLRDFEIDTENPNFNLTMIRKEICETNVLFTVYDVNNNAIEGASVLLRESGADIADETTDLAGEILIENLCDGLYTYKISKEGFKSKLSELNINDSNASEISRDIILEFDEGDNDTTCCDGKILINITDNDGNILDGADVILIDEEGNKVNAKKSLDGRVLFEELCKGLYTVVIEREGFETLEFQVPSDCDDFELLKKLEEIEECCDGEVCFVIKGNEDLSRFLTDAKVSLSKNGQLVDTKLTTDDTLCFTDLCEGDYFVEIEHKNYPSINFNITVDCDSTIVIDRKLLRDEEECCTAKILIQTKDKETGENIEADVTLKGKDYENTKSTGNDGVAFEELCEGEYTIRIFKKGYGVIEKVLNVECDSTYSFEELMENEECCNGRAVIYPLKDSTERLIEGAEVTLWKNGKAVGTYVVTGEPIVLENLCEGEYGISIHHKLFKSIEFEFSIKCDDELEFRKNMKPIEDCCNGEVTIYPKDEESGEIIDDAIVLLKDKNGKVIGDSRVNDGKPVVYSELCEGEYTIVVESHHYERYEKKIEVKCDNKETIIIKMTKNDCCEGVINVLPKDKETGDVLNGAIVVIKDKNGNSLRDQKVEGDRAVVFDSLCTGNYIIVIEHEDYARYQETVEVDCKEETNLIAKMTKHCCDGVVSVLAKDKETKDILNGAKVSLHKNDDLIEDGETIGDKSVIFDGLCEGNYTITIIKDGYKLYEWVVEIKCGKELEFIKELETDECCDNNIKIKVLDDETNEVIEDVIVKLWKDGKVTHELKTNNDGYVELDELCKGKYGVDLMHGDYKNIEFNFEVDCKVKRTIEKKMTKDDCCNNRAEFKVRDKSNSEPIEDAEVELVKNGKVIKQGRTDNNGKIVFEELCEGKYQVNIKHEHYEAIEFLQEFDCNGSITIEKKLNKSDCCDARLELKIKDEDLNYLKGVTVKLYKGQDKIATKTTNSDGRVVFEGICESDEYSFSASKDGFKGFEFDFDVSDCKDDFSWTKTMEKDECCTAALKLTIKDDDSKKQLKMQQSRFILMAN